MYMKTQSRKCLSLNYVYKNPIMEVFVIELCIRKSNRGSVCHPIRCEACGAPQLNPVKCQLPIAECHNGHAPFNPRCLSFNYVYENPITEVFVIQSVAKLVGPHN